MARPPHVPQSEAEFEEFFDLSVDLLCIVGFDGYFKRVNAALERTLGFPKAELFSQTVFDITHPDDVEPSMQALAQLAEGRDVVGFESRVICADGSVRWTRVEHADDAGARRRVRRRTGHDRAPARRGGAARGAAPCSRRAATSCACWPRSRPRCGAWPRWSRARPRPTPCSPRWGGRSARCSASTPRTWAASTPTARSSASRSGAATRASRSGRGSRWRATACPRGCCSTGRPARMDGYEDAAGVIAEAVRETPIRFSIGAPITVEGRPWGVMIASSQGSSPFPAGDRVAPPELHGARGDRDLQRQRPRAGSAPWPTSRRRCAAWR